MYVLTVTACDQGTPQLCNTTDITVSVMDINDNAPVVVGETDFTVSEDAQLDDQVGCVSATDADSGQNANITFSIDGSLNLPFTIVGYSGCILVSAPLDHEADMVHSFTVVASDNGDPSLTASATVTVRVSNVNDHPPTFTSPANASVRENAANAFVVMVTTSDPDEPPFNHATFFLVDSADGRFNITQTGLLSTAKALDRESDPVLTVVVGATDGRFTVNQTIIVRVLDENDNAPVYNGPSQFNETENTLFMLFMDFDDADIGSNSVLAFTVNNSNFTFINDTRWLRNTVVLDRDPRTGGSPMLVLQVTATDQGSPSLATSVEFTVVLADVNDNAPEDLPPRVAMVRDGTLPGTVVTTLNATDNDEGKNAQLVFSFAVPDNRFFINSTSGELVVNTTIELAADSAVNMTLFIRVSDLGLPSMSRDYELILFIVDALPTFTQDSYSFCVTENSFSVTVGQVMAVDRDLNASNDKFFFTVLTSSPYGGFSFMNNSLISPPQYLDYEDASLFTLTIGVGNGEMVFDNATVRVCVNDTNDNPPLLSPRNISVTLKENSATGSVVLTAVGLDFDGGANGQIVYRLLSGAGRENFDFNSNGNLILVNSSSIDHEVTSSYTLEYEACDSGNVPRCSGSGYLVIVVEDVDDIPPVFTDSGPLTETLSEAFGLSRSILEVTVVDNDTAPADITLTLVPAQTHFQIEQVSGILRTTNVPLDFEESSSHSFLIMATDTAGASASVSVTINVEDVDDNRPEVLPSTSTVVFTEEGGPKSIGHLTITDADTVSQSQVRTATVSLHRTPNAMEPFPATGGFCDHANFSTLYESSSFKLCNISNCRSLYDALIPIGGAVKQDGIFHFPSASAQARNSAPLTQIVSVSAEELVNFTFSFWVRLNTGDDGFIVEIDTGGQLVLVVLATSDQKVQVLSEGNLILETPAVGIRDDQYHHLVVVRSGSGISIYLDCVLVASNNNGNQIDTTFSGRGLMFFGRGLIGYVSEMYFCPTQISQDDVCCVTTCGERLRATVTGSEVTATVNHRTRTISLECTANCSLALLNSALDGVSYESVLDEPHPLDRGLFVRTRDAIGPSNHSLITLRPSLINDKPPVLDLNGGEAGIDHATNFTELSLGIPVVPDYAALNIPPERVLYDTDSGYSTVNRLVIEIANASSEHLSLTQLPEGIVAVFENDGTRLTLMSSDPSVEHFPDLYVTALGAVRFQNTQRNPGVQQNILFTVFDSNGVHSNDPVARTVVSIQSRNDPPVLDLNIGSSGIDTSVVFREVNREVTLLADAAISITDPDSTLLHNATVHLRNIVNGADETLSLDTSSLGVSTSLTSSGGIVTLTVTGALSLGSYIQVLKSIKYRNTNKNPTAAVRMVEVTVTDAEGTASEVPALITINIELYNDPPEVYLGGPASPTYNVMFVENRDSCVAIANTSVSIMDPENTGIFSALIRIQNRRNSEQLRDDGNLPPQVLVFLLFNSQLQIASLNTSTSLYEMTFPHIQYCNNAEEPLAGVQTVIVQVTDSGIPGVPSAFPRTTTAFTYVTIEAVNDFPQLNFAGEDSLSIRNEPTPIIDPDTITLSDNDNTTFDQITITIVNPQDGEFYERIQFVGNLPPDALAVGPEVNTATGAFTFTVTFRVLASTNTTIDTIREIRYNNRAPNITTKPDRQICIRVRDGIDFSNPVCVNVTISEPNDFAPQFTNNLSSLNLVLNETQTPLFLVDLDAVDNDADLLASSIRFTIEAVNSITTAGAMASNSSLFNVDPATGELTAPQGLDAESFSSHNVTVRASDNGNPNQFSFVSVLITVVDVNDVSPQFMGTPYLFDDQTVRENLSPPRTITTITASDGDATSPNNIIVGFTLNNNFMDGEGNNIFDLNTASGELRFIRELNAERQREYILNVSVQDGGNPPLTTYTTVTIRPLDINDNAAEIAQLTSALYITGSNQTVQSIGPAIRVIDPDENTFINNLRLSIVSPEGARPYINCLGECQGQRLASSGLLSGAINLLDMANFNESLLGFSRLTIGAGGCSAVRFQRIASDHSQDGSGRIPRSALPPNFVSGEFTVSLVMNITNEGYVLVIVNSNNPSTPRDQVTRYFNIWVRRRDIRFNYVYGNNQTTHDDLDLPTSQGGMTEFFTPQTANETRHFVFVYSTNPNQISVYLNCQLLGKVLLMGALIPPPMPSSDVFIGHSEPSTSGNPFGGHLGGDLHGLYYFQSALSEAQIQSFCQCGHERLHVPNTVPSSITVTNAQDHVITLRSSSSSDTESIPVGELESFLRSVGYENTYRPPTLSAEKRLSFFVQDIVDTTTSGFIEFVDSDSNIPVIDLNGQITPGINYGTSFTEDAELVDITSSGVTVTRDNGVIAQPTIANVTVQLNNKVDVGEYLTGMSGERIKVSGSQTATLTITGPGLPGEFNAALKTLKYNNDNDKPNTTFPRQISFTVVDTEGRMNSPLAVTSVTVISTNDAPQLALSTVNGDVAHTVTFHENGAAVQLAPNTTVSDVDSDFLQSAQVQVATNFHPEEDLLLVTQTSTISAHYNSLTGLLTLTGSASLADYQSTLRSIQFTSTANPALDNNGQPASSLQRQVTMLVSDGELNSTSVSVMVNFIPLDNPPVINLNGSSTLIFTDEDSPLPVFPNGYIEDPDNTRLRSLQITLQNGVDGDLLDDGTTKSRILSYSENTVSFFTSILRNISYVNDAAEPTLTQRTVLAEVSDFSAEDVSNASVVIEVRDLNDNPPTFAMPLYNFAVNENVPAGTTIGTIHATDADRDPTTISFTISNNLEPFSLSPSSGPSPASASLITDQSFDFESGPTSFTFTVVASDGQLSSTVTVEVIIRNVNEPPLVSPSNSTSLAAADQSRPLIQTSFQITDVDAGDTVTNGTLILSDVPSGSNESLTLNQTLPGYSFTRASPLQHYVLTNTGSSLTFEEAIQYIVYVAGTDVEDSSKLRTVTLVVFDSSGLQSSPVTIMVSLADIPVFLNTDQYTTTLTEGLSYAHFLQVTATVESGGDVIVYEVQENFGVSIDENNGSLSLSQPLNFEMTGSVVTFEVYAIDTLPPARTGTATVTINVVDSNDVIPMVNVTSDITIQSNTSGVLFKDIVVADPDNSGLVGASVTINGSPLVPSPFKGRVCVDELNIITKYATTCGLTNFTRLITNAMTYSGASIETDMFDNSILSNTGTGYALVNANFYAFRYTIQHFTLIFWMQPTAGRSGYVIFFSNPQGTERYLAVYFDAIEKQLIVTLKQVGVHGLLGQVRICFQLPDDICDGQYHLITLKYWSRTLNCMVDGTPMTSVAVTYKNLIGQVFSEHLNCSHYC